MPPEARVMNEIDHTANRLALVRGSNEPTTPAGIIKRPLATQRAEAAGSSRGDGRAAIWLGATGIEAHILKPEERRNS